MRIAAFVLLIAAPLMAANSAAAQNSFPAKPPGGMAAAVPAPTPTATTAPDPLAATAPDPQGGFGPRPGHALRLQQKAWENPTANKTARQIHPGFLHFRWSQTEVQQINVREGLLTTIMFPQQEEIVQTYTSDPASFESSISPNRHVLIIRPLYAEVDGDLVAYGSSGNAYTFYLRSWAFDAPKIPDTLIQISVPNMPDPPAQAGETNVGFSDPYSGYNDINGSKAEKDKEAFRDGARDFARTAPTYPVNMANNIEIKVRNADDQAIAPIRAWHDEHFTYLDFGPRASSMNTWPVASLIVQGVESPVGSRTTGRENSMMVIEAVGDIVLRDGQLQVCLKTVAPNRDERYSIPPLANDDPRPLAVKNQTDEVVIKGPPQKPPPRRRRPRPQADPSSSPRAEALPVPHSRPRRGAHQRPPHRSRRRAPLLNPL